MVRLKFPPPRWLLLFAASLFCVIFSLRKQNKLGSDAHSQSFLVETRNKNISTQLSEKANLALKPNVSISQQYHIPVHIHCDSFVVETFLFAFMSSITHISALNLKHYRCEEKIFFFKK